MASTSAISFDGMKKTGELGRVQRAVVNTLRDSDRPLTGREIEAQGGPSGAWKRLSELERAGRVRKVGTQRCQVTGRVAAAWEVTRRRPRLNPAGF